MVTALASLLSERPVKHTVGMTGEVTLQGRVLPIGGFKQKALAAHAAGLTDVILPERNRGDLDDIPEEVREQMTFHPVMTVQEVLDRAGITTNRNQIPDDPRSPFVTSGLRLGSAAETTAGMGPGEFDQIAALLSHALRERADEGAIRKVREAVASLCREFNPYRTFA